MYEKAFSESVTLTGVMRFNYATNLLVQLITTVQTILKSEVYFRSLMTLFQEQNDHQKRTIFIFINFLTEKTVIIFKYLTHNDQSTLHHFSRSPFFHSFKSRYRW